MSITKHVVVDQIEVVANGAVQVRTRTNVVEDGSIIGSSLHRHVVNPGDDYSSENERVQAICAAAHTPEVIDAYNAAIAAQGV
jgi:hypothetical protein